MLLAFAAYVSMSAEVPNQWYWDNQEKDGVKVATFAVLSSEDRRSSLIIKCDIPYKNVSIQYIPDGSIGVHENGKRGKPPIRLFMVRKGQKREVFLHWDFFKKGAFAIDLKPKYNLSTKAILSISEAPATLIIEAYDRRRNPFTQTFHSQVFYTALKKVVKACEVPDKPAEQLESQR